jgi:hypothetical protein
MKTSIAVALMLFVLPAFAQVWLPPPEDWKEEVTTQIVENEDRQERERSIKQFEDWLALPEGSSIPSNGLGNGRLPDRKTLRREIESTRAGAMSNREDWIRLKSNFRHGDRILRYAAPPLSGPIGFVLVRDGVAIDAIVTGYQ